MHRNDPGSSAEPFRLPDKWRRIPALGNAFSDIAEWLLALERLRAIYESATPGDSPAQFASRVLELLQVRFTIDPLAFTRLPRTGGAIVVANHPFGGPEGLWFIARLLEHRPDVKLLANRLLWRIPELRDAILPLDVFGRDACIHSNASGLRRALRFVQAGGLLVLFPAGEVSHFHVRAGRVCDPPWSSTAARLIRLSGAPVIPVHFSGSNGLVFQALGLIHPRLRTLLLTRELLRRRNRDVSVAVGHAIPAGHIRSQADDETLASSLRLCTYALERTRRESAVTTRTDTPIGPAIANSLLAAELTELKAQVLVSTGELQAVFAHAHQLPWTLQEIGRLREVSFRAVGEGTGRSRDIDIYDDHYVHLIAWHPGRREIAGAYRIGHVDRIVNRLGRKGLYTHSLFSYGDGFLRELGPALELGRSFIVPEYQRSFAALLCLWRGIAEYVLLHPQYRVLFGPVSFSGEYRPHSHALVIEFLRRYRYDVRLARLIRARTPFRRHQFIATLARNLSQLDDLDQISGVIEGMEPDGKGVPILLRQYLRLGASLIGFNVDRNFSNVIDGMIAVDLTRTDRGALQKYMGKDGAARYLSHHAQQQDRLRQAG